MLYMTVLGDSCRQWDLSPCPCGFLFHPGSDIFPWIPAQVISFIFRWELSQKAKKIWNTYQLCMYMYFKNITLVELLCYRIFGQYCCKKKQDDQEVQSAGPEFDIGRNTLDLIYSQALCWSVVYTPLTLVLFTSRHNYSMLKVMYICLPPYTLHSLNVLISGWAHFIPHFCLWSWWWSFS